MWVTSVDNYQQDGVIFKGNVRNKDPSAAYAKMKQRLAVSLAGQCVGIVQLGTSLLDQAPVSRVWMLALVCGSQSLLLTSL